MVKRFNTLYFEIKKKHMLYIKEEGTFAKFKM